MADQTSHPAVTSPGAPSPPIHAEVPVSLTRLIGRESELTLALDLLARPDIRLLTLTGPGGIGKTRLLVEIASALAPDFPGGVRYVALESVRDPDLVAATLARSIDVQPTGETTMFEAMVATLRPQRLLLVIDNFEQVIDAAPLVAELLTACPRLRVIVSSRMLLRVSGEHTLAIPPLVLPAPDALHSSDHLARYPAIQLFAERAQAVDHTFTLDQSTLECIAEICQRLDGLPLAIELAASRVRHLGPKELLARLDNRLQLLEGGMRNQPDRLRTMRNAIDWSFELLTPCSQELARTLAVFAGGFTLDAAEQVVQGCAAQRSFTSELVDGLSDLVDASLLQVESRPETAPRYRMLETIGNSMRERLAASSTNARARNSHAGYFLALAEAHTHASMMPDGERIARMLEAEHANFRAALEWLEQSGDVDGFLRLSAALGGYWSEAGHYREGRDWLRRALAGDSTSRAARAKALVALGILEIYRGEDEAAKDVLTTGLQSCLDQDRHFDACLALIGLGGLAALAGDLDHAASLLERSLATAGRIDDPRIGKIASGWAVVNLAVIDRTNNQDSQARQRLETALSLSKEVAYVPNMVMALGDLGNLAHDRGDHAEAFRLYQLALALGRTRPSMRVITDVIEAVGIVAIAMDHPPHGVRLLGAAESLRERVGLRYRVDENRVALDRAQDAAIRALGQSEFDAVREEGRVLGSTQALAEATKPLDDLPDFPTSPVAAPPLTPREVEVLHLVANQQSNAAIAAALFLSVRTVENHVAHIMAKFRVHSRTELTRIARRSQVDDRPLDVGGRPASHP